MIVSKKVVFNDHIVCCLLKKKIKGIKLNHIIFLK